MINLPLKKIVSIFLYFQATIPNWMTSTHAIANDCANRYSFLAWLQPYSHASFQLSSVWMWAQTFLHLQYLIFWFIMNTRFCTVIGRLIADAFRQHCHLWRADSIAISRRDVIAIDSIGLCCAHHLFVGYRGCCGGRHSCTITTIRPGLGKFISLYYLVLLRIATILLPFTATWAHKSNGLTIQCTLKNTIMFNMPSCLDVLASSKKQSDDRHRVKIPLESFYPKISSKTRFSSDVFSFGVIFLRETKFDIW